MDRNIIIGILVVVAIAAGGFAFFQTQNLTELQDTSTQVASDLRSAGTQSADEAIATATQSAANAIETGTQQADNAIATGTSFADSSFETATEAANIASDNAAATGTQQADEAFATQTRLAENAVATETELADNARATQTRSANRAEGTRTALIDSADATGTQLADEANTFATESANDMATQSVIGTDTADNLATQQIELTVAAIVFTDSQATSDAANVTMSGTLEALTLGGEGIHGDSMSLPGGFNLFVGEGYEIALPEDFVGGDFVSGETDDLEDELDDADLNDIFDALEDQDENFLFFAVDSTLVSGVPRATISLIHEDALRDDVTLQEYIGTAVFSLQGDFALIVSDLVPINGQLTGRIIIDQQLSDATVRQVQYIFAADGQFYVLTITTPASEYANIRESLETIAFSLRVQE